MDLLRHVRRLHRLDGLAPHLLALLIMLVGSLVMTSSQQYELALPGVVLMAFGMGIRNAAVFKMVPQEVPQAVGGATGWVGGLGAFGGFAIPPVMAFAVHDLGSRGYAISFVTFILLALPSPSVTSILEYTYDLPQESAPGAHRVTGPASRVLRPDLDMGDPLP